VGNIAIGFETSMIEVYCKAHQACIFTILPTSITHEVYYTSAKIEQAFLG
jgi:hypothetical protein